SSGPGKGGYVDRYRVVSSLSATRKRPSTAWNRRLPGRSLDVLVGRCVFVLSFPAQLCEERNCRQLPGDLKISIQLLLGASAKSGVLGGTSIGRWRGSRAAWRLQAGASTVGPPS